MNVSAVAGAAISGLVATVAPILLAVYLIRRYKVRTRYWAYGILVFLIFEVVTRIPAVSLLQRWPYLNEKIKSDYVLWLYVFFLSFSAGLFEEGGRWLAFRFLIPEKDRRWDTSLVMGAGHGGLESFISGVNSFVVLGVYCAYKLLPHGVFSRGGSIARAVQIFETSPSWEFLFSGWERLAALAIQIALTAIVLQSFSRGNRWWWYALIMHTFVNFTGIGALHLGSRILGAPGNMFLAEGLVTVYAFLSLWLVRSLKPSENPAATAQDDRIDHAHSK
jgi:uncharacterized membrane protein YhfC